MAITIFRLDLPAMGRFIRLSDALSGKEV